MSDIEKTSLMVMLNRCSALVNGEMEHLQDWANESNSLGRSVRCQQRRVAIAQGARAKMDSLLGLADATPAKQVLREPNDGHAALIKPNEDQLETQADLEVDELTDITFEGMLNASETNCNNAVLDAQSIFADCISPNPMALFVSSPHTARTTGASGGRASKKTRTKTATLGKKKKKG